MIFSFLVLGGISMTSSVFLYAVVKDREDKLRYLLNFAGIRSSSYWLGIFFAEWILYSLPITALTLVTHVLQIKTFVENAGIIYLTFLIFGLPFISLMYVISFVFDKMETAGKYGFLILASFTATQFILIVPFPNFIDFIVHTNPLLSCHHCLQLIMKTQNPPSQYNG